MLIFNMPRELEPDERIRVRIEGKVDENCYEYSIGFGFDFTEDEEDIEYQFKYDKTTNTITQNYNDSGELTSTQEDNAAMVDGPFSNILMLNDKSNESRSSIANNGFDYNDTNHLNSSYSILGPNIALEFAFNEEEVFVYTISGVGHNVVTNLSQSLQLDRIKTLKVAGIEKVSKLSFIFDS